MSSNGTLNNMLVFVIYFYIIVETYAFIVV